MQFACKYVQLAPCCYDNGTQLQELVGIERKENKKMYKIKYFLLQTEETLKLRLRRPAGETVVCLRLQSTGEN